MNESEIKKQSEAAYNQWCEQWRLQAKEHSRFDMKPLEDFRNTGIGRVCVLAANGASLEEDYDTIKANRANVDILACDKSLSSLLDNGITPDFVLLCDANVSYEKYCEPYKDKLSNTVLFANVCANTKWTREEKIWKAAYFFVNEDVLKSEREFSELSGCKNFIPAGTNVSNAMVVFLTQSNNSGKDNFFGYDKYLLTGYDYSWESGGKYYAGDEQGGGKYNYMRHMFMMNHRGNEAFTSSNLMFSARWLDKYVRTFKLPVVQCSKSTILNLPYGGKMEEQITYRFRPEDAKTIQRAVGLKRKLVNDLMRLEDQMKKYAKDHYYAFLASI